MQNSGVRLLMRRCFLLKKVPLAIGIRLKDVIAILAYQKEKNFGDDLIMI